MSRPALTPARRWEPMFSTTARWGISLFFALTAYSKLSPGSESKTILSQFSISVPNLNYVLAGVECFLAGWLLSGTYAEIAAASTAFTLSVFTGVIVRELLKSRPLTCGCIGIGAVARDIAAIRLGLLASLLRNLLLLLGCMWLYSRAPKRG